MSSFLWSFTVSRILTSVKPFGKVFDIRGRAGSRRTFSEWHTPAAETFTKTCMITLSPYDEYYLNILETHFVIFRFGYSNCLLLDVGNCVGVESIRDLRGRYVCHGPTRVDEEYCDG